MHYCSGGKDPYRREKKDFSVVIPVRNNIGGLLVTLGAFDLFTAQKDMLEVVLIADNDDSDLETYRKISKKYKYDIQVLSVEKSDNFSRDYYNHGVTCSSGGNVMVYNDDCYMQTNHWDDIIRERISANKHFNGIYLVSLMDSTFNDTVPFPKFPMLSRKAIDTVGFFFYPQVRMWPADKVIYDLYKAVGCVITCHNVKMQHDHNYNHTVDPSKSRMLRLLNEDRANGVFPVNANKEAEMLRKAIEGGV
jgi:hypothetical protein